MSVRQGLSKTYRPPAILPRQVGLSFAKTSNARKLNDLALKTRLSISDRARDAARFKPYPYIFERARISIWDIPLKSLARARRCDTFSVG
jgi:hypothetical protein